MLSASLSNIQFGSEDVRTIATIKFSMNSNESNCFAIRALTLASLVQSKKIEEAKKFFEETKEFAIMATEGDLDGLNTVTAMASAYLNIEITDNVGVEQDPNNSNNAKASEDFEQKIDNYNYTYSYNDPIIRTIRANLSSMDNYQYNDVDFSKVVGNPPPDFYKTTYTKHFHDLELIYDRGMLVGTDIHMLKAAIKMIDNPQDRLQCFATIEAIARCIWKWNYVRITPELKSRITNDFQMTQEDIRREISKYNRTSNPNKIMRLLMHFTKLGIPFNVKMFKIPTTEMSFVMNSSILSSICPDIIKEFEAF